MQQTVGPPPQRLLKQSQEAPPQRVPRKHVPPINARVLLKMGEARSEDVFRDRVGRTVIGQPQGSYIILNECLMKPHVSLSH